MNGFSNPKRLFEMKMFNIVPSFWILKLEPKNLLGYIFINPVIWVIYLTWLCLSLGILSVANLIKCYLRDYSNPKTLLHKIVQKSIWNFFVLPSFSIHLSATASAIVLTHFFIAFLTWHKTWGKTTDATLMWSRWMIK